jgi:hypothetical protein
MYLNPVLFRYEVVGVANVSTVTRSSVRKTTSLSRRGDVYIDALDVVFVRVTFVGEHTVPTATATVDRVDGEVLHKGGPDASQVPELVNVAQPMHEHERRPLPVRSNDCSAICGPDLPSLRF